MRHSGQPGKRPDRCALLALLIMMLPVASGQATTACDLAVQPPVFWRHALAWTLSSDAVLFGRLAGAVLLHDGVLAVADRQLGQVLLIAPDGTVRQVLAVAGEGPGRVVRLAGVCELDGERLLLVQAWPGRVEVVRRDGTPERSLVLGGRGDQTAVHSLLKLAVGGGRLVAVQATVRVLDSQRSRNTLSLSCLDSELVPQHTVLRREIVTVDRMGLVDETEMDFPFYTWCLVGDRQVAIAPQRASYRLELHDLEGGLGAVFHRDLPPLPRPAAAMDRLRSEFTLEVGGQRRAIEFKFHQTAQMIQDLVALGPRCILLTTAYSFHEVPLPATARLDLLDLVANAVREVRLTVPFDAGRDRLLALPNRDLVVLTGEWEQLAGVTAAIDDATAAPAIAYWRYAGEQQ